MTNTDH